VLTWPLAARFTTLIAGDDGDHYQTLWGWWWWRYALTHGQSPFWTSLLFHPHGASLAHQSFDVPGALVALPLWGLLPPLAVFNTVVVFTVIASGVTAYLLGRALGAGRAAAFVGGCLYTFGPYHFGHLLGHMHVAQMEWTPLYGYFLVRALEGGR